MRRVPKKPAAFARKLGARIAELRAERGLTQEKLAWEAGFASKGFSLHAGVHLHENDREGLERLLRYGARPPFSLERHRRTRSAHCVLVPRFMPSAVAGHDAGAGRDSSDAYDFVDGWLPIGVFGRSGLRHALVLTRFASMTRAGVLPS